MKGICKPKSIGVIVVSEGHSSVAIGVNSNQRWDFETRDEGRICLQYKNIGIFMPHRQFDEDWEIIKSE
jgi:hypothetical protein